MIAAEAPLGYFLTFQWPVNKINMIRRAGIPDLDALLSIEHRCFEGDYMSRRSMIYMLKNPAAHFLVAEDQDGLQGYILSLAYPHHRLARHYSLAVLPAHRRSGIAGALLDAVEIACGKEGYQLETKEDNHGAMRLYARLGYRITGRKPAYYEDGMDAVIMVKIL